VRTPDPKQRWLTFVHKHAKVIVACDFFVVVTATFRTVYVFVILEPATRRMLHRNVTATRQRSGLAAVAGGASVRPSVSIRDPRPGQHLLETAGPGSDGPWSESAANAGARTMANSVCEPFGGTLCRECLDYLIPLNERP
jgi:hypothetical protein